MTPEQVVLVKNSWSLVTPIADKAAELFYSKLFELDPPLKSLFKGDMTEQGRKLMQMINTAVHSLDKLESIVPAVEKLGERHADYGVKDKDYDTVGAALLWTLETGLGEAFTMEVKEAWTETYSVLAQAMKTAAAKAA